MTPEDIKIIHQALDTFQQVLNWCYEIEDDDSRLPLNLGEQATGAINAATLRFQSNKVKPQFLLDDRLIYKKLKSLEQISKALEPNAEVEDYCENCRINNKINDPTYIKFHRHTCAVEHLNLAIGYFQTSLNSVKGALDKAIESDTDESSTRILDAPPTSHD